MAQSELPSLGEAEAMQDAQLLLQSCRVAGATPWVAALALLLEDVTALAGGFGGWGSRQIDKPEASLLQDVATFGVEKAAVEVVTARGWRGLADG
jgi:hypothetical protein